MNTSITPRFKRIHAKHGTFLVPPKDIYVGRSLELYGEWCESEVALFSQLLAPGATVVEVGANIGSHTVPIARAVGPTGKVFAVEMQPFVAQLLGANLLANDLAHAHVVLAGVAETAGHLDVPMIRYDLGHNFGGVSVELLQSAKSKSNTVRVQLQPLDDLISVSRLDLLKLDVENLELQALRGAQDLITRHRPVIYLENDHPDASQPLLNLLHGHGYHTYWHRSVLFNPANHNGEARNVFGTKRCVNLVALPFDMPVVGLSEATDASTHPKLWGQ